MEHPCHRCRQPVEDGVPFCQQCGAPQIRVADPEPVPPPLAEDTDSAQINPLLLPGSPHAPVLSLPIQWSAALRPCALAAGIAALAVASRLMAPLLAVLAAGFLAVAFYRQRTPGVVIKARTGSRLGAFSGLLCFGMSAIFEALRTVVLHKGDEIRNIMLDAVHQSAARYQGPEFQPALDFMRSTAGLALMATCFLILVFITFVVIGTLGGALGGAFLGRRDRP